MARRAPAGHTRGAAVTAVLADHRALRRVFGTYPTGVAVVAALVDGRPVGLAASSFVSVSLDPPLVSVCVAHTSTTWPVLRTVPRVGISVLAADQEAVGRQLGARVPDRFAGLPWSATGSGAVSLDGAAARLECSVHQHVSAGDHDIVLLAIHDHEATDGAGALVFHGSTFRTLA